MQPVSLVFCCFHINSCDDAEPWCLVLKDPGSYLARTQTVFCLKLSLKVNNYFTNKIILEVRLSWVKKVSFPNTTWQPLDNYFSKNTFEFGLRGYEHFSIECVQYVHFNLSVEVADTLAKIKIHRFLHLEIVLNSYFEKALLDWFKVFGRSWARLKIRKDTFFGFASRFDLLNWKNICTLKGSWKKKWWSEEKKFSSIQKLNLLKLKLKLCKRFIRTLKKYLL